MVILGSCGLLLVADLIKVRRTGASGRLCLARALRPLELRGVSRATKAACMNKESLNASCMALCVVLWS